MEGVKKANHIDIEVLLQPNNITLRAMEDLDLRRVCEDRVELMHPFSNGRNQEVDYKVFGTYPQSVNVQQSEQRDLPSDVRVLICIRHKKPR